MPSYLFCHGARTADSAIPEDASMETSSVVLDTSPRRPASVDKKRTPGEDGASLSSAHFKVVFLENGNRARPLHKFRQTKLLQMFSIYRLLQGSLIC
jgi:hypothetical protein